MTVRAAGAALAAVLAFSGASPPDVSAQLQAVAKQYYASLGTIAKITSRESTMDYYYRLNDDVELQSESPPDGYSSDLWQRSVAEITRLDLSAATQLLTQRYVPMTSIRGLGETFIKSSKDGTMQSVAVYVPSTYAPGTKAPLLVFLHGRPQSESELIAPKFVTDLAERTGTIVVAPYGRGYYDFHGVESDVYDALHAAEDAFTTDPRRHYLAGYSMGGFSVFHVAPVEAGDWAGVMSIAGSLLGSEAKQVRATMHDTPIYVLTGSKDDSIPTQYPTITAIYLRDAGFPVSFYSLPGGTHRLVTLLPIFSQALDDMEHGIIRAPGGVSSVPLPLAPPAVTLKT